MASISSTRFDNNNDHDISNMTCKKRTSSTDKVPPLPTLPSAPLRSPDLTQRFLCMCRILVVPTAGWCGLFTFLRPRYHVYFSSSPKSEQEVRNTTVPVSPAWHSVPVRSSACNTSSNTSTVEASCYALDPVAGSARNGISGTVEASSCCAPGPCCTYHSYFFPFALGTPPDSTRHALPSLAAQILS